MNPTPRSKRLIPFNALPEEEVRILFFSTEVVLHRVLIGYVYLQLELTHLKFLSQPPVKKAYPEIIERFNANVPYSGLLHSVTQDVSSFFVPLFLCEVIYSVFHKLVSFFRTYVLDAHELWQNLRKV